MPTADGRFDEVFDAQATFRVVLNAMARPGTVLRLPASDPRCPLPEGAFAVAILRTLLDHEVAFAVVSGPGPEPAAERLAGYLASATGSRVVPPEGADYVLSLGAPPVGLPLALRRGTPTFPDESATVVALVPSFGTADGTAIALAGPGVRAGSVLRLGGWTRGDLAAIAAANAAPPLGIDLILVDPAGAVACLPRSTRLTLSSAGETPAIAAASAAIATLALRPFAESDLAAVKELHALAFERLAADHHTPAQLAAHRSLTEGAAYDADLRRSQLALAVDHRGAVVGSAGWIAVDGQPGTARIRKVYVHPDLARRGLATRLVRDAERRARAAGHSRFVVRATINAEPFYARLGYRRGERGLVPDGGDGLPAVFMEKDG